MKTIYLIRHTKVGIPRNCFYGHTDVPLSGSFFGEATFLRAKLPKELSFPIWSSPMARCRILGETFEVPYETDRRLMELNFGDWEMKQFDEIPDEERNAYLSNFVHQSPPNGETYLEMAARAMAFVHELVNGPSNTFAVITHAGIIRSLLCRAMGLPLENAYRFDVDYGSVSTILLTDQGFRVGRMNL